jgi:hypothetical protein
MRQAETIRFEAFRLTAMLVLVSVLALPSPANGQNLTLHPCVRPGNGSTSQACALVREIDDPHTGQHWFLMHNPAHPGGPGVLVPQQFFAAGAVPDKDGVRLEQAIAQQRPVIRAGDSVTVEQSDANADIRLEGIALSPVGVGSQFRVRLKISGKVVETEALGPGRAVLIAGKGFWP